MIKDRENQINDLKIMLCDATRNIENSSDTIEKLKFNIKSLRSGIHNSSSLTTELVHENVDFISMKKDLLKYQKKVEQLEDFLQLREMEVIIIIIEIVMHLLYILVSYVMLFLVMLCYVSLVMLFFLSFDQLCVNFR